VENGTRQALIQPEKIKIWHSWKHENQALLRKNSLQSLANSVYFFF